MIKKIEANRYGVVQYATSKEEEVALLPIDVAQGSICVVLENTNVYMFDEADREWKLFVGGSSSGGGSGIPGINGREIELQKGETAIQWRYVGDNEWTDLVALDELKGKDGTNGRDGIDGKDGVTPNVQIGTVTTLEPGEEAAVTITGTKENPVLNFAIPQGPKGDKGENGKDGVGGEGSGVSADDKVDYMGNQHETLKETNDANIEYVLGEINTTHYEGEYIIATDTFEKQVKSAFFKGVTKYKDVDTGEILDEFDSDRNLELISVKSPSLNIINTSEIKITEENVEYGYYVDGYSKTIKQTTTPLGVHKVFITSGNTYIYSGIDQCTNLVTSTGGGRMTWMTEDGSGGGYTADNQGDTTIVAGGYTGYIYITVDTENLDKIRFRNIKDPVDYESSTYTLTTPTNLILRSKGNIYDELDLITGRITQRIGGDNEVLAQEVIKTVDLSGQKVYSYDGTTHYICSSADGHPAPILSIDVPTNLSALVARQHSTIEAQTEQITTLEWQNEMQDELIDITLMATDEMFMMLEPLLMQTVALQEGGDSKMVDMYVAMVQRGLKTIEQVPARYREQVKEILAQLEG